MHIVLIGINHKTAPLTIRERLAIDKAMAVQALTAFKAAYPGVEIVLLSTCNRVECYVAVENNARPQPEELAEWLANFRGVAWADIEDCLYIKINEEAVTHLFTVCSSLDSMVIGESQITAQVKESYKLSCEEQATGKILNRLFHDAFRTTKEIITLTSIANRRVSVAGVAVELARQLFSDIQAAKVVIVGAGQMGDLLVEHFQQEACQDITVVNRSRQRSCQLARKHAIRDSAWEQLDEAIVNAEILVGAATAGDGYLFTRERMKKLMARRRNHLLLIIDITVPRSFEPEVDDIDNVYLYSIDDLARVAQDNISLREGDIEQAVEIIYKHTALFMEWFLKRDLGPVIGQIKAAFEQIQTIEMEKFFVGPRQDACCKVLLETSVGRVVNKLSHCVIKNIDILSREHGVKEAEKFAYNILANAEQIVAEDKAPEIKKDQHD